MRRCNQSREKAATSVGPMISKTADERWNLCPFDCKSLICRQSVKSLLTPTEGSPLKISSSIKSLIFEETGEKFDFLLQVLWRLEQMI